MPDLPFCMEIERERRGMTALASQFSVVRLLSLHLFVCIGLASASVGQMAQDAYNWNN